jgi:hypothetical protein
VAAALIASGAPARAEPANLLLHRAPSKAYGVRNAHLLTDGVNAPEGDDWSTDVTATFDSADAFVEYDLGRVTKIVAGYLQGDNDDRYLVQVSDDGKTFKELWIAAPARRAGLRARATLELTGSGRYLRISAREGDGRYSMTELALFSAKPAVFPPRMSEREGTGYAARVRNALLFFGLGLAVFLFATGRRSTLPWLLIAALPPLFAGYTLLLAVRDDWPVAARELSLLRAVTAAASALALAREAAFRSRFAAHRVPILCVLGVSAALACASFYDLGHPQFRNDLEARPEFVHTWDMRVYYPFAKYFEELGYDGVYLASAAAYLDDVAGATLGSIGDTAIRDLRNHRTHKLKELATEVNDVRRRFTPARWASFKHDMRYFREVMGADYLRTMNDHGANATPVWVASARLVFFGPATETALVLGGLLDAVLLAFLFVAIGRSFGLRPMLIAMVLFGANDFYMFGTNWGGATLRHDWLVYLGLGVCALHVERWLLGGVFFGLSVMIRAFPGVALIGVTLSLGWWLVESWLRERKPPALRTIWVQQRAAVHVLAAALMCMVSCFVLSGLSYSFGSWVAWWHKVTLLNGEIAVNDESLRALVSGVDTLAGKTLRARAPLYLAALLLCVVVVAVACRRRRLDQAVLLSLPLISVLTNPSNYYNHVIFLLPLVGTLPGREPACATATAVQRQRAATSGQIPLSRLAAPLLAVCIGQYWTTLDPDVERHFQMSTALLFAGLGWFYFNVLTAAGHQGTALAPSTEAAVSSKQPPAYTAAEAAEHPTTSARRHR